MGRSGGGGGGGVGGGGEVCARRGGGGDNCPLVPLRLSWCDVSMVVYQWDKYIVASQRNGTLKYTGLCMDLLDILALSLNFRSVTVRTS